MCTTHTRNTVYSTYMLVIIIPYTVDLRIWHGSTEIRDFTSLSAEKYFMSEHSKWLKYFSTLREISFLQGTMPFSLLYKHKRNTKPNVSLLLWKGWLNMYCNIKQNVYFFPVWSKLTWYFISVYTVKVIHVIDNQYYRYNRSKGSQKKEVFKECQKHTGEWRSVQSFLSPILGRGVIKIKVSLILLLFITSQCKIILTCNIIFLITFNFASYW